MKKTNTASLEENFVNIKNLEDFSKFLDRLTPSISYFGGRRFTIQGKRGSLCLNQIVQRFEKLPGVANTNSEILKKIYLLDTNADALPGANSWMTRLKRWLSSWFNANSRYKSIHQILDTFKNLSAEDVVFGAATVTLGKCHDEHVVSTKLSLEFSKILLFDTRGFIKANDQHVTKNMEIRRAIVLEFSQILFDKGLQETASEVALAAGKVFGDGDGSSLFSKANQQALDSLSEDFRRFLQIRK